MKDVFCSKDFEVLYYLLERNSELVNNAGNTIEKRYGAGKNYHEQDCIDK